MSEFRTADIGEVVHDTGETPDVGWFIVGEGGYFDVDNACWCEPQEGDAPWTTEFFDLCGTARDLIAFSSALAVRYAQAQTATPTTNPAAAATEENPMSNHPIVAIDPDNREQVQRLAGCLIAAMCKQEPDWDKAISHEVRSHLATALREYADPGQAASGGTDMADDSYLDLNAPPIAECDKCGRSTWDPDEVIAGCRMPQPDGSHCLGTFATTPNPAAAATRAELTAEQED